MSTDVASSRSRRSIAVAAVAALIAVAGCAGHPAKRAPSSPSAQQPASQSPAAHPVVDTARVLAPFTKGLLLGVFPGSDGLAGFDREVAPAALTVTYAHFGSPVQALAGQISSAASQHAEAILELEPGPLGHGASQVAAGTGGSDAWLAQFGRMIANVGKPVAISFFPEMNGPWHAAWTRGPANYIRAYRHVHDFLTQYDGSLITWVWQSSAIHKDTPSPVPWYPGRAYVDVASLDSYYYYPHDSFEAVFGQSIRQIRRIAPTLPVMIGEVATGPLFNRQVWEIKDLFAGIRRSGLIGLVWFNQFQHHAPYQFHQDWRLQDHPAALAAFRACLVQYGPLAKLKPTT